MKYIDSMTGKAKKYQKINCDHSTPLKEITCFRCKCELGENSIPKQNFRTKVFELDKKTSKLTNTLVDSKLISEITIIRGSFDDVIGWTYVTEAE